MGKRDQLSPLQEAFKTHLIADPLRNATHAAIKAGCQPKNAHVTASKWLKIPKVKAAIDEALAAREKRTLVDADYIVTAAQEVAHRCLVREPVMVRDGRDMVQATEEVPCDCSPDCTKTINKDLWKFDSAGAVGALKLLASHVRGYTAPLKAEVTGKDGEPLVPPAVPVVALHLLGKEDLLKIIEATKE